MDTRAKLNISEEALEAKLHRMNQPLGPPTPKPDELSDKLHRMQQPTPKSKKREKAESKNASGPPLTLTPTAADPLTELADLRLELKKALKELKRREEQLKTAKEESRSRQADFADLSEKYRKLSEKSDPTSDASILLKELNAAKGSLSKARKELEEVEETTQTRQRAFREECEKQQRKELAPFKQAPSDEAHSRHALLAVFVMCDV